MKIIGINCSPKKSRNTYRALESAIRGINEKEPKIETEIIELAGKEINGCIDCGFCKKNFGCSQKDDFVEIMEKLKSEDLSGIIIASPVYLGSMTSQCKALIDRMVVLRRNGFILKNIIGGALATGGSRNGGQELTIQAIHASMLIQDMIIVSDGCDTAHFGGTVWSRAGNGDFDDEAGYNICQNLGKRIAETCMLVNKNK